jgi:hypothetical protein
MNNIWLKKRARRLTIIDLNRILVRFVGQLADPVEPLVREMRKEVLAYFKTNQEKLKFFVNDGVFNYRFNISHNKGKIMGVEFEPLP